MTNKPKCAEHVAEPQAEQFCYIVMVRPQRDDIALVPHEPNTVHDSLEGARAEASRIHDSWLDWRLRRGSLIAGPHPAPYVLPVPRKP